MATDLSGLPDDVRELIAPHLAESEETLDAISIAIAQRRDEAKSARTSSGIEQTWKDCEESYIGIDDANRLEFQDAKWAKPMSMDGPVTTGKTPRQTDYKSTAFVRLTARYVDAGSAKLAEILLPIDDKAFSFSEMPVPELIKAKKDTSQVVHDGLGNAPLTRPARPGEAGLPPTGAPAPAPAIPMPTPSAPATPALSTAVSPPAAVPPVAPAAASPSVAAGAPSPRVPLTVKDIAEEHIEMLREKAKLAETRIYDWMVECQYQAEMRKVIFDAARIGVGVLKAPFPKPKRGIVLEKSDNGVELQIKDRVMPAAKWVDPWNIFPDQACGENIHLGDFVFERDYLSARQVRDLKKIPGYIEKQIDKVLAEGPEKTNKDNDQGSAGNPSANMGKGRYEIWYYYGTLKREEMDCICSAAGKPLDANDVPAEKKEVYAIVTMINSHAIRATINPLDSGAFPYHSVPWQRRAGHWAGIGVGEQIVMPQRTINAATRAMLNNAGKSAGSQIVIDQGSIKPADGSWIVTPDKIWYKTGDSPGSDVRQAFLAVEIPNVTEQLLKIIQYALQLAEESTSIPLITQGQSGPTTPDTFGAAQLQNNNANQLLRSIGYAFDDYITEPVVRQFYEWLLLDPDVPDEEKGEFTINAHGSIALVERAIQDQSIAQMAGMALNPNYGIDPKKWAKLYFKSKRLDPADLQYTEEQQAKIDATPPPDAPAVAVAKIGAQTAATELAAKQSADQRTAQNEQQIAQAANILDGQRVQTDAHKVAVEHERTAVEATVRLHEIQLQHQRALLEYATKRGISLSQAKVDLAKTAMTLDTQRDLNAADNAADLRKQQRPMRRARPQRSTPPLIAPPDEAGPRAGNGRAFEQAP